MGEPIKDGGPAFPVSLGSQADQYSCGPGLSLRDYFAAKADQPGVLEIITAAGLRCEDNFWVVRVNGTKIKFTEWYEAMSQAERFALQAKVRFQLADAMLAAREVQP